MTMDPQSRISKIINLMRQKADYQAACELRELVKDNPPLNSQWGKVAEYCHSMEEMDAGLIAARRFVENNPTDPERQGMLSEFLVATGRIQEALDLMLPFGEKFADHPPVHYGIGVMLSRLGRFEEAEERFSRVLDLQPSYTLAWEQLAQIHTFTPKDSWIARYQEIEQLQHLMKDEDKPPFFYGLGKLYDDLGEYDRAFTSFQKGAKYKNNVNPFNKRAFIAHIDRLESLFTSERFSLEKDIGDPSNRPIFIVGIPRSGTTLVDRIISAHSGVTSGGEMPLFRLASLPFDTPSDSEPLSLTSYNMEQGATWPSIGQDYLSRLTERFGPEGRVTDKTLVNYLYIYPIMCALPNAKIIYCRRDPVDTAWSNFRTLFGTANLMSYDLDDIALYQNKYNRLMSHWQKIRSDAILPVQYEQLVADPDRNIGRILDFCDLTREDACLNSHTNTSAVSTASFKQVRKPIYTSSVGGAKSYARHLAPWIEKLYAAEID